TLPGDPDFRLWPGVFAITNVVSVCPNPSRMSAFQAVLTALITTGLSGSPAANTFCGGLIILVRSAWINIRHTVGGAQIDVTPSVSMTDISCLASNRT